MRHSKVTPFSFTPQWIGETAAAPTPLSLLPMAALSAEPIEALDAALRALRRLGDLYRPRPAAATRRITGATLVVQPDGNLVRRALGRYRRPPCTCPSPFRRRIAPRHQTDH